MINHSREVERARYLAEQAWENRRAEFMADQEDAVQLYKDLFSEFAPNKLAEFLAELGDFEYDRMMDDRAVAEIEAEEAAELHEAQIVDYTGEPSED